MNQLSTSGQGSQRLSVKVTPHAGRSEITGFSDGVLRVRIAAPPVEGRANRELIDLLSRALGLGKSSLTIIKGQTSRQKVVAVAGITREEIIKRLSV
ncbi:MAG: YggU family protein [Chloroflexi bacterium RBG_16_60_22]|nr:MAG: YggU family protein [Chloroflexi bacterium RBG_16_60_22]